MDWTGLTALVIATAALLATIWQIARTEGMRAPETWNVSIKGVPVSWVGRMKAEVDIRAMTPFGPSDIKLAVWGTAKIEDSYIGADPSPDTLGGTISWDAGDKGAYVGVIWTRPSYFRRNPVAGAYRIQLEKVKVPERVLGGHESGGWMRQGSWWRWARIQPLRRSKPRRGRWKKSRVKSLISALPPDATPDATAE